MRSTRNDFLGDEDFFAGVSQVACFLLWSTELFTDGSHPTAVEVEETTPFWIDQLNRTLENFGQVHKEFHANIQAHQELIKSIDSSVEKFMKTIIGIIERKEPEREVPWET